MQPGYFDQPEGTLSQVHAPYSFKLFMGQSDQRPLRNIADKINL